MRVVSAKYAIKVWRDIMERIVAEGTTRMGSHTDDYQELLNVVAVIENPELCELSSFPDDIPKEDYEKYAFNFVNGDIGAEVYTYGSRMRGHWMSCNQCMVSRRHAPTNVDQIRKVIRLFKQDPRSRQATVGLFDPRLDHDTGFPPCLCMVDFKIGNKGVNLTAVFRSHDIYGAWLFNFWGLKALQEYVAEELMLPVGEMVIHSISAHIYSYNQKDTLRELGILGDDEDG